MIRIVRNEGNFDSCKGCYFKPANDGFCDFDDCMAASGYHYKDEDFDEKETELINEYIDQIKKDRKKLKLEVVPVNDFDPSERLILDYDDYIVFEIKDNTLYLYDVDKYEEWVKDGMPVDRGYLKFNGDEWGLAITHNSVFLWCNDNDVLELSTLKTYTINPAVNLKHHPVTKNIYLR